MYVSVLTLFPMFELILAQEKESRCKGSILTLKRSGERTTHAKLIYHDTLNMEIPEKFDVRLKWPKCKSMRRIKDQGKCGGCWAFASTSVIADRICIASQGKYDLDISIQDLMECCTNCTSNDGNNSYPACSEGYPHMAFEWFVQNGIVTGGLQGCKPIEDSVAQGKYTVGCKKKCTNRRYSTPYEKDKWYGKEWVFQDAPRLNNPRHIQAELMVNGPVVATFKAFSYMNDVPDGYILRYNKSMLASPDEKPYLHGVKLVGWNVAEDGTPVWIISNSWGQKWCDLGFCRIQREIDDLEFETHMMTSVVPIVKKSENPKKDDKTDTDKKRGEKTDETNGFSNNFFRIYELILTFFILFLNITIPLLLL